MSQKPAKSMLDHYGRVVRHEVEFYAERVEQELKWLESGIDELRGDIKRGSLHEYRNIAAKAVDVIEYAGKLRAAIEQLEVLDTLAKEDKP